MCPTGQILNSVVEVEVELPGCWTMGWPDLQMLHPIPGPSKELVVELHHLRLLLHYSEVEEAERSSCYPPNCLEEEDPSHDHLGEEEEENSSCLSFRCCHSSVDPRAAGLTDSSEAWLSQSPDLPPSCPNSRRRLELAALVCPALNSAPGSRHQTELPVLLLLRLVQRLVELEYRHPALP